MTGTVPREDTAGLAAAEPEDTTRTARPHRVLAVSATLNLVVGTTVPMAEVDLTDLMEEEATAHLLVVSKEVVDAGAAEEVEPPAAMTDLLECPSLSETSLQTSLPKTSKWPSVALATCAMCISLGTFIPSSQKGLRLLSTLPQSRHGKLEMRWIAS